jgi:hypothetical protein
LVLSIDEFSFAHTFLFVCILHIFHLFGISARKCQTQRMWGDWFMLSEANTCVYSRSGFPRFACLAAAPRAQTRGPVFEKDICGTHRGAWRSSVEELYNP